MRVGERVLSPNGPARVLSMRRTDDRLFGGNVARGEWWVTVELEESGGRIAYPMERLEHLREEAKR